ncbi:oxidoreductase family protein [Bosea psychrotolerans]|uniref:Oxidoreductase family protein n=1 Tax=Bosea psychrotolerans TaxID=1871628 RepID=A0A2S4MPP2_9HYPH|nr:oxidoreductase family protein [Bosea psychrotolerans]
MCETDKQCLVLASRPVGRQRLSDFRLELAAIPTPAEREVLLRTLDLSLDPYMRGRMSAAQSYAAPAGL